MLKVQIVNATEMSAGTKLTDALFGCSDVVVIQHFYDAAFMITDTGYVLTYHCDSGIEDVVCVSKASELYAICTSHFDESAAEPRNKLNFTGHYVNDAYCEIKPQLKHDVYVIGCISKPDAFDEAIIQGNIDIAVAPDNNLLLIQDDSVWRFDNFKQFIEFCMSNNYITNTIVVQ